MKKNTLILAKLFLFSLMTYPLAAIAKTNSDEVSTEFLIILFIALVVVVSLILDEIISMVKALMDTDGILNKIKQILITIGKIFLWLIGGAIVLLILLIGDLELIAQILSGVHVWFFGGYVIGLFLLILLTIIALGCVEIFDYIKEKITNLLKIIFRKYEK